MPDAALRVSVRRMVEFSLRGGDLLPVSASALQEGARAHRASQESVGATAERPVRWQGTCEEISADIQGRIDLLWEDAAPRRVEELKLLSPAAPLPASPLPAHRMQAVCYGFMLCRELGLDEIDIRVSYVTETGAVRAFFEERLSSAQAEEAFFAMLRPLAQWERLQRDYALRRNASLEALRFPYAAYRPGQREMAVQVYAAICQKKRLYTSLPTGTGKSAATLFPALKALGTGKARQVFYLTARGTAQLPALDALSRMESQGLLLRSTVITAKEKCCPLPHPDCHPDRCPRAKGYYDRELPALLALCRGERWDAEAIQALCEERLLCPFEFSLALCEISDVVICDYNYVFDPMVSLRRIIGQGRAVTVLADEAHNLPGRVRDMLSCGLDSRSLAALRRDTGKLHGRKSPLYAAMTALLSPLREAEAAGLSALQPPVEGLLAVMAAHLSSLQADGYADFYRSLLHFRMTLQRMNERPEDYKALVEGAQRERRVFLLCLDVAEHLRQCTRRMQGCVCFSATLSPLEEMKRMLGGTEEDGVFSLPSPFPPQRLLVLRRGVNTRYQHRQESAAAVARSILAMTEGKEGKYIAYFPSFAYLSLVLEHLLALRPDAPLNVQARSMDAEAREDFLQRMRAAPGPLLSLCVLGGVFSEGIDLPGRQLIGVAVVGVGLPQVNEVQEALRRHYEFALGDGFAYAYRYPGMQKVLQAAGRVIRSEKDAGVVLLLDSRYAESAYARLLPPHYRVLPVADEAEIRRRTQEFWHLYGINDMQNT